MVVHHNQIPLHARTLLLSEAKSLMIPVQSLLLWKQWKKYPVAKSFLLLSEEVSLLEIMTIVLNRIVDFSEWYIDSLNQYHEKDWAEYNSLKAKLEEFEADEFIMRVAPNLQLKDRAFLAVFNEDDFRRIDSVPEMDQEAWVENLIMIIRSKRVNNSDFENLIRDVFGSSKQSKA